MEPSIWAPRSSSCERACALRVESRHGLVADRVGVVRHRRRSGVVLRVDRRRRRCRGKQAAGRGRCRRRDARSPARGIASRPSQHRQQSARRPGGDLASQLLLPAAQRHSRGVGQHLLASVRDTVLASDPPPLVADPGRSCAEPGPCRRPFQGDGVRRPEHLRDVHRHA